MRYSIGAHPAFNCPAKEMKAKWLLFGIWRGRNQNATWVIDPSGLDQFWTKSQVAWTTLKNLTTSLPSVSIHDAVRFCKNMKSKIRELVHAKKALCLQLIFEDFKLPGDFGAKPAASFL